MSATVLSDRGSVLALRDCAAPLQGAQWVGGAIFLAYLITAVDLFIRFPPSSSQYGLFRHVFRVDSYYPDDF